MTSGKDLNKLWLAFQAARREHPGAALIRSGNRFVLEACTQWGAKDQVIPASVKSMAEFALALDKVELALSKPLSRAKPKPSRPRVMPGTSTVPPTRSKPAR